MIRINLLPVQQEAKHRYGKQQLIIGLLLVIAEIAVLYTMYSSKSEQASQVEAEISRLQAEITTLQARAGETVQLETQRAELEAEEAVHRRLQGNRSGPVQVLDELKYILNPPQTENDDYAQRTVRAWDTTWDPTSVWLELVELSSAGGFSLTGTALDTIDISEFVVRLASSSYFRNVQLLVVTSAPFQGQKAFTFEITASVVSGASSEGGS